MMLDRVEIRKRYFNRVLYVLDARIQKVGGISSRVNEDYTKHRILWDLDECSFEEAISSFSDIQDKYNLNEISILSDRNRSYGGVCNTEVSFKELLHILIDTDLIDPLYVRYTLTRHEAILRLTNKEGRLEDRRVICELKSNSDRKINDRDFYTVEYETGYSRYGLKRGDYGNEQRTI